MRSRTQLYQAVELRDRNQSAVDTHCVHIIDIQQQLRTKLRNVSQHLSALHTILWHQPTLVRTIHIDNDRSNESERKLTIC